MGLSESEQRKLDEIERALERDDPGFAVSISIHHRRRRRRIVLASAFLVGTVVLLIGLVETSQSSIVGVCISVVGFLTMLAAVAVFVRRPRHRS